MPGLTADTNFHVPETRIKRSAHRFWGHKNGQDKIAINKDEFLNLGVYYKVFSSLLQQLLSLIF